MLLPLTTLVQSIQPRSQSICSIPFGFPSHPSFTWYSLTVTKMFCYPQSANRSAFKYRCFVVSCSYCHESFSSSILVLFLVFAIPRCRSCFVSACFASVIQKGPLLPSTKCISWLSPRCSILGRVLPLG